MQTCGRGLSLFGGGNVGTAGVGTLPEDDFVPGLETAGDQYKLDVAFSRLVHLPLPPLELSTVGAELSGVLMPIEPMGGEALAAISKTSKADVSFDRNCLCDVLTDLVLLRLYRDLGNFLPFVVHVCGLSRCRPCRRTIDLNDSTFFSFKPL